jgi:hypothetical protein
MTEHLRFRVSFTQRPFLGVHKVNKLFLISTYQFYIVYIILKNYLQIQKIQTAIWHVEQRQTKKQRQMQTCPFICAHFLLGIFKKSLKLSMLSGMYFLVNIAKTNKSELLLCRLQGSKK